ncbi:hypothetical protein [Parapedobacter soli]|uniref:hypothetical protein n=1 Tax=Parapedobacter soli TaxID=416955 RepID=UPI0021C57936|nr:hypothetical protein [Parapedobacter soli]
MSSGYRAQLVVTGSPLFFVHDNWVGLAFSRPEKIEKLRFLCRNDDNFIKLGELYELFYWNGVEWESLGLRKGDTNKFLHFDRVPRGSLLLLRNHTKGKEERPFTYEREQQVWW